MWVSLPVFFIGQIVNDKTNDEADQSADEEIHRTFLLMVRDYVSDTLTKENVQHIITNIEPSA